MSAESLSLYFGVDDENAVDLEIISVAAIAWVENAPNIVSTISRRSCC